MRAGLCASGSGSRQASADGRGPSRGTGLIAKLARKRPSPLARGKTTIWAGGILYFLGQHNWLFYPSAPTHLSGRDLARAVGLTQASIAQKAGLVKRCAALSAHDTEFRRAEINAIGPLAGLYRYGL